MVALLRARSERMCSARPDAASAVFTLPTIIISGSFESTRSLSTTANVAKKRARRARSETCTTTESIRLHDMHATILDNRLSRRLSNPTTSQLYRRSRDSRASRLPMPRMLEDVPGLEQLRHRPHHKNKNCSCEDCEMPGAVVDIRNHFVEGVHMRAVRTSRN
jgi:hypothetical protein